MAKLTFKLKMNGSAVGDQIGHLQSKLLTLSFLLHQEFVSMLVSLLGLNQHPHSVYFLPPLLHLLQVTGCYLNSRSTNCWLKALGEDTKHVKVARNLLNLHDHS